MKRNLLVISTILLVLASACAPQAPTANPADVAGTAQAAAFTMIAQTQAALPTNTIPPTETMLPTQTNTVAPPDLPTAAVTAGPGTVAPGVLPGAGLPTAMPTFTPQAGAGAGANQNPCNQPLTAWQGKTANFTISNQTKPKGTIVLSMYVETEMGQCGYLIITGDSFSGPAGQYSAGAFISGKKNMKSFGSFKISGGNWKIVVKNDNITAAGSCYPDC